jgi:hypothetical protein
MALARCGPEYAGARAAYEKECRCLEIVLDLPVARHADGCLAILGKPCTCGLNRALSLPPHPVNKVTGAMAAARIGKLYDHPCTCPGADAGAAVPVTVEECIGRSSFGCPNCGGIRADALYEVSPEPLAAAAAQATDEAIRAMTEKEWLQCWEQITPEKIEAKILEKFGNPIELVPAPDKRSLDSIPLCTCTTADLIAGGCRCGAMLREQLPDLQPEALTE